MEVDGFGRVRQRGPSDLPDYPLARGRRESYSPPRGERGQLGYHDAPHGSRRRASLSPPRGSVKRQRYDDGYDGRGEHEGRERFHSRDDETQRRGDRFDRGDHGSADRGRERSKQFADGTDRDSRPNRGNAVELGADRVRPAPMRPMMSFRRFTQRQEYDASPEVFQRKYDEYQINYAYEVSDHFFETHKAEEWFVERYNPFKQHQLENATCVWSRKESELISSAARTRPAELVAACCLEPVGSDAPAAVTALPSGPTSSETIAQSPLISSTEPESGKHLSGHLERTVYVTGIPASCPRAWFERNVLDLLEKERPQLSDDSKKIDIVNRVIVAQPSWHKKEQSMSFDRNAWIVLSHDSPVDLRTALRSLRDGRFTCPGPLDRSTGETTPGFSFKVTAVQHTCRAPSVVPSHMSDPKKVDADTRKALQLADLLDSDRDIPTDFRLAHLVSPIHNPEFVNAFRQPTDLLDVAIAYLRRVHFVVFYAGLRFRDEAHLLTGSSNIFTRSVAYHLPRPPLPPTALREGSASVTDIAVVEGGDLNEAKAVVEPQQLEEGEDAHGEDWRQGSDSDDEMDERQRRRRRYGGAREEMARGGEQPAGGWSSYSGGAVSDSRQDGPPEDNETSLFSPLEDRNGKSKDEKPEDGDGDHDGSDENAQSVLSTASKMASDKLSNWRELVRIIPGREPSVTTAVDRRLHHLFGALRAKAAHGAGSTASRDAEDVKAIELIQSNLIDSLIQKNCSTQSDGRAKCGMAKCSKVFKNAEFLAKHIRSKHAELVDLELMEETEEFTRVRFEADELGHRPLPLIEVEVAGGLERRSVKEVIDIVNSTTSAIVGDAHSGPPRLIREDRGSRRWSDGGVGGRGPYRNRDSRRDEETSRHRGDGHRSHRSNRPGGYIPHPPLPPMPHLESIAHGLPMPPIASGAPPPLPPGRPPAPDGTPARRISYYVDVDEPKESSVMELDYGVSILPPPKRKKRSLGGTAKAAAADSEAAPAEAP